MLAVWSISPASACCSPFWVNSTPPPPLPLVPPPSLDEDRSTHSAMKPGPGTSPGRTGNSCSSYSGGQKNSCACSSTHTKPAPTASSASRMVAGPSEGPVGGQGDCALAGVPGIAISATITATIVTSTIMRLIFVFNETATTDRLLLL